MTSFHHPVLSFSRDSRGALSWFCFFPEYYETQVKTAQKMFFENGEQTKIKETRC